MRHITVGLVVVLLIVGCLVGVGCGGSVKKPTSKSQTTNKIPTQSNSGEASTKKGSVGEAVRAGNYEVKVIEWKFATPADFGKDAEDSDKIVVADVEITNVGSAIEISGLGCMSLRTPEGYEYDNGWGYALPEPEFPDSDIDPGDKARGFVTFKVPEDIGSMEFQFDTISEGGKVRIKLQ